MTDEEHPYIEWDVTFNDGKEVAIDIYRDGINISEMNEKRLTRKDHMWLGYYEYLKMSKLEYHVDCEESQLIKIVNNAFATTMLTLNGGLPNSDELHNMNDSEKEKYLREIEGVDDEKS